MGRATEGAAYQMSKQRLHQHAGVDMNLFMVKKSPSMPGPCVSPLRPQGADIYEDIASKAL